ncbi:MAG: hypothetical protein AAGD25_31715 [Cyanobacteria bacterium P01_F01_bin.150]
MNLQNQILQIIVRIIALFLGDPRTRIARRIILVGLMMFSTPLWLRLAEAYLPQISCNEEVLDGKYCFDPERLDAANKAIFLTAWVLLGIGISFFIYLDQTRLLLSESEDTSNSLKLNLENMQSIPQLYFNEVEESKPQVFWFFRRKYA